MRNSSSTIGIIATAACAAAVGAAPVSAQTIDHGALEALFDEPVTTNATGQPQRASDAPANMVIITADDIRRSGARDIPGVLRHVGGIDIMQWTSGQTDLSVRGYDREFASRLLVLINGRQVYADHFGFTPWHGLPVELSEIRQIEVVKGPNSALFGFNAVGGVVNIITYDPEYDEVGAASATVGTQDYVEASAVQTFRLNERAFMRVSLGKSKSEEFNTQVPAAFGGDTRFEHPERESANIDGVVKMSDRVRLRLNATVTEFSRNEVPTGFSINGAAGTINSFLAALSADTHTGVWTARAYTNKLDVASVPTPALPNSFNFLNRVTVAQLEDVFTLGSAHTLRGAVEYRHNTVNTTPVSGGEISYDVYAAAGMWNWRITPALSLTNAVRYDQLQLERSGSLAPGFPLPNAAWNRTIAETSFNSGLVWRASERDTFRAMVSRGVQLPNLTHLGAVVIVTPFYNVSGGPFINPSATTNYELTWDHDLESLGAQVRTAIFYEDNKNMTGTEGGVIAGPGGVFLGATNVGDSQAVGLEIGLKGEIADAWRWSVDYRAEAIDDDFAPPDPIRGTTTNYEDTTPEHLINASLGWSGGRWEADGFVRYQSDVSGVLPGAGAAPASLTPIDAYAALDGRVAYRLTDRATFAVSGQNLGTAEQRQTSAPEVERRIMGTLSFNY